MPRKPKFIRQCDSMQCGVASLAMATGFLGVPYGIDDLARICYVTREHDDNIRIRKVRELIGRRLPWAVRYGNLLLLLLFVAAIAAVWLAWPL